MSGTGTTGTEVIGVVGAGQIGRSVAHAFAEHTRVVLVDRDTDVLADAVEAIRRAQLGRVLRRTSVVDPRSVLANITTATGIGPLGASDLLIENITESPEEKVSLHRELAGIAAPHAVIAANTSAIPLAHLAPAHGGRADRLLGLHFMMPVVEIRCLELIRAAHTSPEAVDSVRQILDRHGLRTVQVGDAPGFVSNRLLMLLVNEAAAVVREGVADAASVDRVLQECFGHRLGPLATADLIGLDTVVRSLDVLHRFTGMQRFEPDAALTGLVAAGRLGHKSGAGFFEYGPGASRSPADEPVYGGR